MDKSERRSIEKIMEQIEALKEEIEFHREEEECKLDNLPEGLRESYNAQRIEIIAGYLDEAVQALDCAISE